MKTIRPLILASLVFSLLLSGCSDGGFSIADNNSYSDYEVNDQRPEPNAEHTGDGVYGGGAGSNSEDNPEETKKPEDIVQPSTPGETFQPIDMGNQVVTFDLSFVSIGDDNYALVLCDENPFEDKYQFAYYTIDNVELENSKQIQRETVDEKITYKFYLGSKESKIYTIQFYNKDGKQYGKANLQVSIPVIHRSFFNNVVNIIQIKVVSMGVNLVNQFNKIKEFFKKIFGGNGLTI